MGEMLTACLEGLPRVVLLRRGVRKVGVINWRRLGDLWGDGGLIVEFSDIAQISSLRYSYRCGGGYDAHCVGAI